MTLLHYLAFGALLVCVAAVAYSAGRGTMGWATLRSRTAGRVADGFRTWHPNGIGAPGRGGVDVPALRRAAYTLVVLAAGIGAFAFVPDAAAQMVEDNPSLGPLNTFRTRMLAAQGTIAGTLTTTFWLLATIEFTFAMIMVALHDGGLEGFGRELVIRILFIGFFYTLLQNGAGWVNDIVGTFTVIGSQAGGIPQGSLSPDGIIDVAVQLMKDATDNVSVFELQDSIALLFASGITFIALLLIAGSLALILIEFYIVGYGGIVLLALGGSRWTSNYALAYLKYAVSIGMKLFIIYVVAGVGVSTITDRIANDLDVDVLNQWWALAGFAVVICIAASKGPNAATGLLNGVSTQAAISVASAVKTAGIVAGGAAAGAGVAAAGAAGAARAGAAAGTSAAGFASAGMQAVKLGAQQPGSTALNAAKNLGSSAITEAKAGVSSSVGSAFPVSSSAGGRMASSMAAQTKNLQSSGNDSASGKGGG